MKGQPLIYVTNVGKNKVHKKKEKYSSIWDHIFFNNQQPLEQKKFHTTSNFLENLVF